VNPASKISTAAVATTIASSQQNPNIRTEQQDARCFNPNKLQSVIDTHYYSEMDYRPPYCDSVQGSRHADDSALFSYHQAQQQQQQQQQQHCDYYNDDEENIHSQQPYHDVNLNTCPMAIIGRCVNLRIPFLWGQVGDCIGCRLCEQET
jgi:hypothetical protein